MPNYVKNILSFDGDQDQVSRLFSTIQGENGPVDFDKLIPMPSELEIESGSRTAAGFKKYMAFLAVTGLKAPSQFEQACETCGLAGGFAYSRNEENPSFLELC